ncbi:DnaJ domain-containing protein [Rubrobacter tropicus]|uniref:DnaJ domain-containing protein n=1 Tax=Rubrobacter tropicus TaxID=2653851 RepID=A0A6G8QEJ7_9ACTN|nr:DnaJ domain-containing protein [Rubrobacter tropicus]QIN84926.1 DnaJ domain-containing protein [Rubrobacter tropicus]
MAKTTNYYEVLGVPREASQAEIRNAYRNLAKELHPDHPGGSATEFSRLQEANAVLSDPDRRREHDESLDLAHAADQLAGLNFDFDQPEDELSSRRRARESAGPSLGERLKGRFGRKEGSENGGGFGRDTGRRTRGRYDVTEARWYEPHRFDPEPVTLKSGATSFVGAFLAFIVAGQVGIWASGQGAGVLEFLTVLNPFMFLVYTLVGLVAGYLAFRTAGWAGLALVFVAALVVGGQGEPPSLLRFLTVGIVTLLVVIWLGNRRDAAGR